MHQKIFTKIMERISKSGGFDMCVKNIKILEASPGKCTCQLKVEKEHLNPGGSIHGGLIATVIDVVSSMGLVAKDPKMPGASIALNVNFVRSAKLGEELIIKSWESKIGKKLAFMEVEVRKLADDKLVATGSHTKYLPNSGQLIE